MSTKLSYHLIEVTNEHRRHLSMVSSKANFTRFHQDLHVSFSFQSSSELSSTLKKLKFELQTIFKATILHYQFWSCSFKLFYISRFSLASLSSLKMGGCPTPSSQVFQVLWKMLPLAISLGVLKIEEGKKKINKFLGRSLISLAMRIRSQSIQWNLRAKDFHARSFAGVIKINWLVFLGQGPFAKYVRR